VNVLLTGATGFIGQRLARLLDASGSGIRVLARSNAGNYETVICDLECDGIPSNALDGIDTVFHLAGFAHDLSDSSSSHHLYQIINVDATVDLARLAIRSGVKEFIYVSSVKAGGSAVTGQCMTEEDQGEPEGIYGKTKRKAEIELLKLSGQSGMHVSIVRPSLVYGPGVKGHLKMMLLGIEQGWFPPLPELGNRRSMIHVDDLVHALMLVAEDNRSNGEIFIATDGRSYSSREIYEILCQVLGKPVPLWEIPKFFFDVLAGINSRVRYKVNKLLGDECYSSEKLQSIGFVAKYSLREMNETSF